MARPSVLRAVVSVLLFVLPGIFGLNAVGSAQTYTPRSQEEAEVLSLVVAHEMKANSWSKSELICLSINGLDPTAALVKSLRQRNLNVRSSSEWTKKFNCGFELQLEYTQLDLSQSVKVRSKVLDLREIHNGEAHIATLMKDGEYSLRRAEGKWSSVLTETPLVAVFSLKAARTTTNLAGLRVIGTYAITSEWRTTQEFLRT